MTKVYNALRQAEAERQHRTESNVSTDALFAGEKTKASQPGDGGELDHLRNILLGGAVNEFAGAVERLEQRMESDWTNLRAELEKFEQRIEDRLVEADSRSSHGQSELREQLLSQSNKLGDMIKERSAEAVRLANEGLQDLRTSKLNGTDFSAFVKALASHIADESH